MNSSEPDDVDVSSWSDPPGIGRSLVIGCAIGVTASMVVVVAGMLALDVDPMSAFGLGVFVAFWGGLGFGTMFGGVSYAARIESGLRPAYGAGAEPIPAPSEPEPARSGDGSANRAVRDPAAAQLRLRTH